MRRSTLAIAMSGLMVTIPSSLVAQTQDRLIEEVVVTGTASGGEMRKLDASFAITNVTEEDIVKFSPKSTADLLKMIPGVWSESSGGVSGANVFVRGFPASGDAPFLTVQLEGAPVFPPPTLSFLENTTLFRIDETIERMEGLRGGPQSVQDNGQPGLTTNFLLKKGGEETQGLIKYTTSDYDLQRMDAVLSGELADDLYYMIGGYVKSTPGIRDAGFNAEKGDQFTINLTKDFDKGSISVYHRATDDHGVWFLPAALNVPGVDGEYTQVGTLNRRGTIQYGLDGETRSVDLGDGRGWDGAISGATIEFEINENWILSDSVNLTKGDANTVGLVPNLGAVNVGEALADPSLLPLGINIIGPLTGAITGRAIDDSEYIQQFGLWDVHKEIDSFTNNLALTGTYETFEVTLGYYTASVSVDDRWSIGNQKYYVVESGGEIISGDSIDCNAATVDSCDWNYDIDGSGDSRSNAIYLSGTYHVTDALSFDAGVRSENHEVDYTVFVLLDDSTQFVDYDERKTSYTVGANFDLNQDQGIFARFSKGYKFPYFDDFRDNYAAFTGGEDLIKEVTQVEFGYKAAFEALSFYATLFGNEVEGDTFTAVPGGPTQVFTNEAYGVEIDGRWYHASGFSLTFNATIQETEITESIGNDGNEAQRQPGYQLRITPSYDVVFGEQVATFYGTVSVVDDRYSDNENTVVLDGYEKFDLGVIYNVNENFSLQVVADNVTDEDALTEGDPRNPAAPNGRFIMPRNVKFSVGYSF